VTSLEDIRLGILGLNEGNGHPYSWAAIFNGYEPQAMASCPYPVIPAYLARQTFPDDAIAGARVTHVWAQERAVAEHVAAAARIPHVVDRYEAMIGEVDAILLARDDAENHLEMSRPALDAGLPIYIDKPVTLTLEHLDELYSRQRYRGQIFSCSAMRFAEEFQLDEGDAVRLGQIKHVQASTPRSWEKYGVHIVEAVLSMLRLYARDCRVSSSRSNDVRVVSVDWGGVSATFTCLGQIPGDIKLSVFGSLGSRELVFRNTFAAFKRTLAAFVDGVRSKREIITKDELARVVFILQRGMQDGNG
jgi:predicted dehydrogenase